MSYSGSSRNVPMPEAVEHKILHPQQMKSGTSGKQIELVANYYRLITKGLPVFHYDVEVLKASDGATKTGNGKAARAPPPRSTGNSAKGSEGFIRKITPKVVEGFIAQNPDIFDKVNYVYDFAKNVYSTRLLQLSDIDKYRVKVNIDGHMKWFELKLRHTGQVVNLADVDRYYNSKTEAKIEQHVITVYDLIFRCMLEKSPNFVSHDKCFYSKNQRDSVRDLPLYDLVSGFTASVRLTEFGLALNLHTASAFVISNKFKTLPELIARILGTEPNKLNSSFTKVQLKKVNKVIGRLRVTTKHTKGDKTYSIDKLIDSTPYEFSCTKGNGESILVSQYFRDEYDLTLRKLPLVKCQGQNIHLPMELCALDDYQFVTELNDKMQAAQLEKSKLDPNVYFNRVTSFVETIAETNPTLLGAFGIELTTKPVKLMGRQLEIPSKLNTRGPFYQTGNVDILRWGLYSFDQSCTKKNLKDFVTKLCDSAQRMGLGLQRPQLDANDQYQNVIDVKINDIANIESGFKNLKRQGRNFLFVVIPDVHQSLNSDLIYKQIKLQADAEVEIGSQCIKGSRLKMIPSGYFDNFLLKVNAKLGGINTVANPRYLSGMPLRMEETMVVGIDVNHPGATERIHSSIAAAVGTIDAVMAKCSSSVRVQRRERVEIVQQINMMIEELLSDYNKANKRYPKNLFVFRDGVSEGQFAHVIQQEIPKIRAACAKVQKGMKLTVVVVQKRHNTRFARTQSVDTPNGRSTTYNVPEGTVVDTAIVEPSIENFLLNSHFSQLGISKPSKYIVLLDELNLSSDQIEKFCFYACHNCARTKNTISIPTAVRYADLCAYRAKCHIEAKLEERDRDGASSSTSSSDRNVRQGRNEEREAELITQFNDWVRLSDNRRLNLYYC